MFNITAEINTKLNSASVTRVKQDIQNQLNSIRIAVDIRANSSNLKKLQNELRQISNTGDQTTQMMKRLDGSIGRMDTSLLRLNSSLKQVSATFNKTDISSVFDNGFNSLTKFDNQILLAAKRFTAFTIAYRGLSAIPELLSNAIRESIDFNKQLTKIEQVSESSKGEVKDLSKEITKLSVNLGVSSTELVKAGLLLKQAGLSTKDTRKAMEALAESALAPNFDTLAETTEGLIAVMRQFKIPADDFKSTLGSMNAVAGAFAVEAADLITVVQKTGGVFATLDGDLNRGKDSLNELLALFTSIRGTTRESADQIATGLRTIFGRLQRTETVDALKSLGVELRHTKEEVETLGLDKSLTNQFVGGYEAIRRISKALNDIPSTDQRFANIVEQIGGLRQLSRVVPLIKQFGDAEKALAVAQSGSTSLTNNAITAQQSLANQITKVKEQWLELGRTFTESDGLKTALGLFSQFNTILTSTISLATPLIPLLAGLAIKSTLPIIGHLTKSAFGKSSFPGFDDHKDHIRKSLSNGEDGLSRLRRVQLSGVDVGQSSQELRNAGSPVMKQVRENLEKMVQDMFPSKTIQEVSKIVNDELINQARASRSFLRLGRQANTFASDAVAQQKTTENLQFRQDQAKFFIKNLGGQGEATETLTSHIADLNKRIQNTYTLDGIRNNAKEISQLSTALPNNLLKIQVDRDKELKRLDQQKNTDSFNAAATISDPKKLQKALSDILNKYNKETKNIIDTADKLLLDTQTQVQERIAFLHQENAKLQQEFQFNDSNKKRFQKKLKGKHDLLGNITNTEIGEQIQESKAKTDILLAKTTQSSTEAKEGRSRQQLVTETDALGRTTTKLPIAETKLKEDLTKNKNVGAGTLSGIILERTEKNITDKKIVSKQLQELELLNVEFQVRQQYINGVAAQIRQQNKLINQEQALILAEERLEREVLSNTAVLQKGKGAFGKDVLFDSSLGKASKTQQNLNAVTDFVQNNFGKALLAAPIVTSGIQSQFVGTADQAVRPSGVGGLGFTAAAGATGAATGAGLTSLFTANPLAIAAGGVLGFANSVIDAQKQIADAKLGLAVQKLAETFTQLQTGLLNFDSSVADSIKSSQRSIIENSASASKFDNPLSTIANTFGLGKGDAVFGGITDRVKVELSKTTSSIIGLLNDAIKKEVNNGAEGTPNEILERVLSANNNFFREQLGKLALAEGSTTDNVKKRALRETDTANRNRIVGRGKDTVTQISNNFNLLAEAVTGAVAGMNKFNVAIDDISNIINGNFIAGNVRNLSESLKGSAIFNEDFNAGVQRASGVLGGAGGEFSSQAQVINAVQRLLPTILSTVRAGGGLIPGANGQIDFGSSVTNQLKAQLEAAGLNKDQIGSAISTTALGLNDPQKLLEDTGGDVSKATQKILEPLSKPFNDALVAINQQLESASNTYISQLNRLSEASFRLEESFQLVDRNATLLARTQADIASRTTGKVAADVLPVPNDFNKRIERLAPGLGQDPARIGNRLEEVIKQLPQSKDRRDNADINRFQPGGEIAFRNAANEFNNLNKEAANLKSALTALSDASNRLAEIQDKINHLRSQEQTAFGAARIRLAGSRQDRREFERGQEAFNRLQGGANINNFSRREANRLFNFVDKSGPREKAVLDAALRNGGQGLGKKDQADLDNLLGEEVKARQNALKASQDLALITQKLIDQQRDLVEKTQNNLIKAIQENTNQLKIQQDQTKLGLIAEQQEKLVKPRNAAFEIQSRVGVNNVQSVLDNQGLIGEFGRLKERKELQDLFVVPEQDRSNMNALQRGLDNVNTNLNTVGRNALNAIPIGERILSPEEKTAQSLRGTNAVQQVLNKIKPGDAITQRNDAIGKLGEEFKISRENLEKIVPNIGAFSTDKNLASTIAKNIGDFLKKEGLSEEEKKRFTTVQDQLKAAGLGSVAEGFASNAKALTEQAAIVTASKKSFLELQTSSHELQEAFDKLTESINQNPITKQQEAEKRKPATIAGFGGLAAGGFAQGGIINFQKRGKDIVPAVLEPGEVVIPAGIAQKNMGILNRMLNGLPAGDIRRFTKTRGQFSDRLGMFDEFARSRNRDFNVVGGLLNSNTIGRPGKALQRQAEVATLAAGNRDRDEVIEDTLFNLARNRTKKGRFDVGRIMKFSGGGMVPGANTGFDSQPALLTPGEVVLSRPQVAAIGPQNIAKIQKLANGGTVQNLNQGNVDFSSSFEKFGEYINSMNKGFTRFGEIVDKLADALDKKIEIDGEQNVNVNVTGLNNAREEKDIREVVIREVKIQIAQAFPHFTG